MSELKKLKNVSEQDRKMLEDAESLLGPEPGEIGFVKNLFWGNLREELIFPYPQVSEAEVARTDALLNELDKYLREEHPSFEIDQQQEIPRWVIDRLFAIGVMGMTIPEQYGGLGLGVTSYNRVLARIGETCASTAVLVSAHQSIGCKALMLFGTEEQKRKYLPLMATSDVSAFCLSEPNVGCDAGGQETRCEVSEDGKYYILNGEKKWSTSGAISGLFTVMAKQRLRNEKTGKLEDRVTAIICTPDLDGVDIFEKNRSKCGIRGTWQARIRLNNVRVPRENLLHKEGKGLFVALSCLNFGRCTLSAGMLGAARRCRDQATKWAQTRFQFGRPLAEFELVQQRIAKMSALTYAMDAVLYMTTGMLDRHDKDIMVETAACKVFNSEMGWVVVNDALQVMGGEGYMTENEVERSLRDSRINTIVEGANEVMQSFIFGYGGKQLAEQMLAVQNLVGWDSEQGLFKNLFRILGNGLKPSVARRAIPLGLELFFGKKPAAPTIRNVDNSLRKFSQRCCQLVAEHSHQFKLVSKRYREEIIKRQAVQARLADNAVWLNAYACSLAKIDMQIKRGDSGREFERDRAAFEHFCELAEITIKENVRRLTDNADETMHKAAAAAFEYADSLPNKHFYLHEASPNAKGSGKVVRRDAIKQFPG